MARMAVVRNRNYVAGRKWVLAFGSILLTAFSIVADTQPRVAEVPAALRHDLAYNRYAQILVQIDLLANPQTASLPIQVAVPEPGVLTLRGTATNEALRQQIVENARRVSGLAVRDYLRTGGEEAEYVFDTSADSIRESTIETIEALFPEMLDTVKVVVNDRGEVTLSGAATSFESKLLLSQAVKSQPGCRCVTNLLRVAPQGEEKTVPVSDDGDLSLQVSALPSIPAVAVQATTLSRPGNRAPPTAIRAALADDAVEADFLEQQIREDVISQIRRDEELADRSIDVDVRHNVVTLQGELDTRDLVEHAIAVALDAPNVSKVLVKSEPISMQKNTAQNLLGDEPRSTSEPARFLGMPLPNWWRKDDPSSQSASRRFRTQIHKTIVNRCDRRVKNLKVNKGIDGITIEAEVTSPRDRTFVLKQIDNVVELRTVPYTATVRIK